MEELRSAYQVYRTLRRTFDTRVIEMMNKLDLDDTEIVNRWVEVEKVKGKRPSRSVNHHYADVTLLLELFLRYSWAI